MTFGVYLLQPPNARVGFLIVERVGNRTLARSFRTMLLNHFKAIYPNHILTLYANRRNGCLAGSREEGKFHRCAPNHYRTQGN